MIRPSNMSTSRVAFEHSSHLVCKHAYLIQGYLLQVVLVADMFGCSWDYTKFVVMCKSGISPGIIKCLELHEHVKGAIFPVRSSSRWRAFVRYVEFLIPTRTGIASLSLGITDEADLPATFPSCCSPCPVVLHSRICSVCAG